jgi:hypothetical protein
MFVKAHNFVHTRERERESEFESITKDGCIKFRSSDFLKYIFLRLYVLLKHQFCKNMYIFII